MIESSSPPGEAQAARVRTPLAAALATAALLATCAACTERPARERFSTVLITLDTTRADSIACYGSDDARTPHIDRLAREGVLYRSAHTVTALTLPAHASMLTGLYPIRHTLRENLLWALPTEADTLAEAARAAGFQTAAFIAAVVLDDRFGLAQGFDLYDSPAREDGRTSSHAVERPGPVVAERAVAWLEARDPERPFFLWMHLFDPHAPWNPAPEFKQGALADHPYLGEIAMADAALGTVVEALRAEGALENTLVIVVGDHGEGLGDHGEPSHGPYCYESTMRVPLIIRHPDGWRAGESSDEIVSVVDVYPTLAEAMGLPVGGDHDGLSLYRQVVPADRGVYLETYSGYMLYGWSQLVGWVDAGGKYLHSSEPQFFDLRDDPGEFKNVIDGRDVSRYQIAIQEIAGRHRLEVNAAAIDREIVGGLEKLGYGGMGPPKAGLPEPLAPSDRPSPQSRVDAHRLALDAMELTNAGRVRAAEGMLRSVLKQNPNNYFAIDRLSICLLHQRRFEEAIGPLERMLEEGPQWAFSYYNLGMALASVGRKDEALVALRRSLALDASMDGTIRMLFGSLRARGQAEEAAFLERELELDES